MNADQKYAHRLQLCARIEALLNAVTFSYACGENEHLAAFIETADYETDELIMTPLDELRTAIEQTLFRDTLDPETMLPTEGNEPAVAAALWAEMVANIHWIMTIATSQHPQHDAAFAAQTQIAGADALLQRIANSLDVRLARMEKILNPTH